MLEVINLPKNQTFYNIKSQSYYNLSYIFTQKRFLNIVVASDHKHGSFALSFENPKLHPYLLSDSELLQLLALNEFTNPLNPPIYPWYEHPLLFYLGVNSIIILVIRFLFSIPFFIKGFFKASSRSVNNACSVVHLQRKH